MKNSKRKLNWVQNWMARALHLIDFDFNEALKWTWSTAMQVGLDKGRKEKTECLSCPLYHADQIRKMGLVEPSPPTTSGKMTSTQTTGGIRQRAITRNLQEHPGLLLRHHGQMLEQKARGQAEEDTPPTQSALPRMPRKLTLESMNDDWIR